MISCKITKAGRNPYGEVLSAVLTVAGLTRPARFSDDSAVLLIKDEALPPRHSIEIDIDQGESELPSKVSSLALPFFTDYDLTGEGPDKIPANGSVLLLTLFEDISLVLSKEQFSVKGVEVYRRIGILKLLEEYMLMYGLTLWQGKLSRLFKIFLDSCRNAEGL